MTALTPGRAASFSRSRLNKAPLCAGEYQPRREIELHNLVNAHAKIDALGADEAFAEKRSGDQERSSHGHLSHDQRFPQANATRSAGGICSLIFERGLQACARGANGWKHAAENPAEYRCSRSNRIKAGIERRCARIGRHQGYQACQRRPAEELATALIDLKEYPGHFEPLARTR